MAGAEPLALVAADGFELLGIPRRVIMPRKNQRDRDRRELEDRVVANMQEMVLPVLDDVQRSIGPGPQGNPSRWLARDAFEGDCRPVAG